MPSLSILSRQFARRFSSAALVLIALYIATPAAAEMGNPRVNQVGYPTASKKVATYKTSATASLKWELQQNGKTLIKGKTKPQGSDAASGDTVHHINFSKFKTEGSGYTLVLEGDRSYSFAIGNDLYLPIFYDASRYFYHNRAGIEIKTEYTGGGLGSYAADKKWARPAGHLNKGVNTGDFNVTCWPGTECDYNLSPVKGWYDAGDHGKYVVNGGISAWKVLDIYEWSAKAKRANKKQLAKLADNTFNIPESGNGTSDLLDEARWQLEFLMAMQIPAGHPKAGMVHHKLHDIGWTQLPLAPHMDKHKRALVRPSVTATLNLAAAAAKAARLYRDIDKDFANQCLTAATTAWQAALANPSDFYLFGNDKGGGAYGDGNADDEFFWAATELLLTTGDKQYLPRVENYTVNSNDWAWADTDLPALMSLAVPYGEVDKSIVKKARKQLRKIADGYVETIKDTGYLVPSTPQDYVWGSNNIVANKMILLGHVYGFTGKARYANAFTASMNYLFGNNPMSFSYISGHGENSLAQPHHRFWAGAIDASYPWVPPGALSGGPNSGIQDPVAKAQIPDCPTTPAKCFLDNIHSWSTNEITVNWNSALMWIAAFQHDLGNEI
ncbi:glycoside hydrolase family 9 protein [Teredinibacter waterburyi]|uniref:glycoside hydrolase family 9 protein n=1 Tax=Teredinibacter waterburyi TaxID=1500538 RepID=UPI00165ED7FA|nr:glycoside hydrolase family 9 protein [Teredinibacter waterburyi]